MNYLSRLSGRCLRQWFLVAFVFVFYSIALSQTNSGHPRLFFDSQGAIQLRQKVLTNPFLNQIWQRYKTERVDQSFSYDISEEGIYDLDLGREFGDGLSDMTLAYIVLDDTVYAQRAIEMMMQLAALPDWGKKLLWGDKLNVAHISVGFAFAWDVFYDRLSSSQRDIIRNVILQRGDNEVINDVYTNVNWTPSAAEGLVGLAFAGDGDSSFNQFVAKLLRNVKENFKEKERNVMWGHGSDGFPHQGIGYWRKYIHVGLFFNALRRQEPENDWFHLGSEYPGSEFLRKTGYPRIYADVQTPDLATITWADSRQVRGKPGKGPFGSIGAMSLVASEYKDGYVMDFLDYMVTETKARFDFEDWATFLFYDDLGVPARSYRNLPLSRYWPDMEAAIFRSSWDKDAMVFFMRSGSPGGHGRRLKNLSPGGHDHPDANGFVIFYNNEYLAAEDGAFPHSGPDKGINNVTYGHNTFLIDGLGQKGDKTTKVLNTKANMDYLDSEHIGYLLGDATDAYEGIDKFHRYVLYKKHKYFIMLDELEDDQPHKYEYLLGADNQHTISAKAENNFLVSSTIGNTKMPLYFVEPQQIDWSIGLDRSYAINAVQTDMLRVTPVSDAPNASFFSLLYPQKSGAQSPEVEKFYLNQNGVSGIKVDGDICLYNRQNTSFTYADLETDARLCFFNSDFLSFEYLTSGSRRFLYKNKMGVTSDKPIVFALKQKRGAIRVGKNVGPEESVEVTVYYPRLTNVLVDSQFVAPLSSGSGWMTFALSPKQYRIGPGNARQTVTDNYTVEIVSDDLITVLSPNGGELLSINSLATITWEADSIVKMVKIEWSPDLGATWQVIADNVGNSGVYNWQIPDLVTDGAIIRISAAGGDFPVDFSNAAFQIDKPPLLSSFTPLSGTPGASVAIYGVNLSRVTNVSFGNIASTQVSVVSDTAIGAIVPTAANSGKVALFNRMGSAISELDFTVLTRPAINSFTPISGAIGDTIAFKGQIFSDIQSVKFNGQIAIFQILTDSSLIAVVPPNATSGYLEAIYAGGIVRSRDRFTVKRPPFVGAFIPARAGVGKHILIKGSSFQGLRDLWFVGAQADSLAVLSDTLVSAQVPNGAKSGAVTMSNAYGSAISAMSFTVDSLTDVNDEKKEKSIVLIGNYPNPFNGSTRINYSVSDPSIRVDLKIFNILGQKVRDLPQPNVNNVGLNSVAWDGRDNLGRLAVSGLYFVRLEAGQFRATRKIVLQK